MLELEVVASSGLAHSDDGEGGAGGVEVPEAGEDKEAGGGGGANQDGDEDGRKSRGKKRLHCTALHCLHYSALH